MGKLIYLFEGKEEVCKGRQKLISPFYFGGFYTGTDRMCKLRCFIRNYGREKVIDLVNYRREKELYAAVATGTDGMIEDGIRRSKEKFRGTQRHCT